MTDARASGHQVQLAGPHQRMHTGAVAVLHLAAEQPADGLQPGMRMRRHIHARTVAKIMWSVVVGEAPRPDERPLPLRQRAADPNRPRPTQRYLARMQHASE
jgi:hypothetical protein